jgi:hypothetical protein
VWTPQGEATQLWVKDLIIPNTRFWDRHTINNLFHHFKAEQIAQIPPTGPTRQDMFTWPMTNDGNYSVKSGYQAIQDWKAETQGPSTSNTTNLKPMWKKIWKLKIPPKYATFIWRLLHKALPLQDNLRKRGINCYPLCPRCNDTIEDHHHVFCGCEWAKQTWFASALTINFNQQQTNLCNWLEECLEKTNTQSLELICALCYHIWKARNLLVFQNRNIHVMDIVQQA